MSAPKRDVAEVLQNVADAAYAIASAVTPLGTAAGTDAAGGHVDSLTEAVMGITAGLHAVAASISDLAEAVREGKP